MPRREGVASQPKASVTLNFEVSPAAPEKAPGAFLKPKFLSAIRTVLNSIKTSTKPNQLISIRFTFRFYGQKHDETEGAHSTNGYVLFTAGQIEPRSDTQMATFGKIAFHRAYSKSLEVFVSGGIESAHLRKIVASADERSKKQATKQRHRKEQKRRERVLKARPEEYFRGKLEYGRKITMSVDKKGRPSKQLSIEHRRYGKETYRVIMSRRVRTNGKLFKTGARLLWRAPKPEHTPKRRRVRR